MRLKSIFYDWGGANEALLLLFQPASPVASWLAWFVSAVDLPTPLSRRVGGARKEIRVRNAAVHAARAFPQPLRGGGGCLQVATQRHEAGIERLDVVAQESPACHVDVVESGAKLLPPGLRKLLVHQGPELHRAEIPQRRAIHEEAWRLVDLHGQHVGHILLQQPIDLGAVGRCPGISAASMSHALRCRRESTPECSARTGRAGVWHGRSLAMEAVIANPVAGAESSHPRALWRRVLDHDQRLGASLPYAGAQACLVEVGT